MQLSELQNGDLVIVRCKYGYTSGLYKNGTIRDITNSSEVHLRNVFDNDFNSTSPLNYQLMAVFRQKEQLFAASAQ